MDEYRPDRRAPWRGLGWFVALLLIGLAALQGLRGGVGPAETASTAAPVAPSQRPPGSQPPPVDIRMPPDTGARDAKVVLEVFLLLHGPCECHVEAALLGGVIGELEPARIRVAFRDLDRPRARERLRELGVRAPVGGFVINGRHRFEVPYAPDTKRHVRTVDLLDTHRDWTMEDIHAALSAEYRRAYGEGMPTDCEQFVRLVSQRMKTGRADVVL